MALSNSFDFTVTRDDIIQEAMERCGVLRLNKSATTDQLASFGRSLNLRVKSLQAKGLELHTYRDAFLFLEADEDAYLLGPTGDHATESYVKTNLATDEATSSTSLGVDSITGISASDNIGIELDDGTIFWTTVFGAPAGSTVTIASGLPSAASTDNFVFTYTTKIQRPLKIADMFVRDVDDNDVPVELVSISEYRSLSRKTTEGSVVQATFDPQLTNARLLVWPTTDDVTDVLGFVYKKPVDDFDAATNNAAFPADWFEFLVMYLMPIVAMKFSLPLAERQQNLALLMEAEQSLWDNEETSVRVQPSRF